MRQLRLVGLNDDGTRLVLRDEAAKTDYLLPKDERLAAALRGDRARLGQLEIAMDSQLRPREMQARVRAGQTPEAVAQAAGLPLDKVLRLVAPVLAEREYIVEQALKSTVRRVGGEGPGLILEPTVLERVSAKGVAPESVTWAARRRDDGAWVVEVSYEIDGREHGAGWTYDSTSKTCNPVDDEARALSGARPAAPAPAFFVESDEDEVPMQASPRLTSLRGGQGELVEPSNEEPSDAEEDDASLAEAGGRGRGSKRASVPSWDEIMFGRRRTRE